MRTTSTIKDWMTLNSGTTSGIRETLAQKEKQGTNPFPQGPKSGREIVMENNKITKWSWKSHGQYFVKSVGTL